MFKKIKLIILFSSKALKRKYRINKFNNPDKRKQMTSGLKLLEQEDVADAIMFAINAPWRMNVSMIELTPTEQVPGGSIIKEAK